MFYGRKGQFTRGQTARWCTAVPFWRSNLLLLRHLGAREVFQTKFASCNQMVGVPFFFGGGLVLYSASILTIAVWQTWWLKTTKAGPDLILQGKAHV